MTDIPHFSLPFRPDGSSFATVEQDSLDEVAQNVGVLVATFKGERLAVPEFGITDPLFRSSQGAPDTGEMADAIATFEPRAEADISETGRTDDGEIDLKVTVSITEEQSA